MSDRLSGRQFCTAAPTLRQAEAHTQMIKRLFFSLALASLFIGAATTNASATEYGVQLPNCPTSGDRIVLTANVVISGHSEGRVKFIVTPSDWVVEILNGCAVSLTAIGWDAYTFVDDPPVHVKMQHPTGGGAYSTYTELDESVIEILNHHHEDDHADWVVEILNVIPAPIKRLFGLARA